MKSANPALRRFLLIVVAAFITFASVASATENGGSIWPVGAESYSSGMGPETAGETLLYEYTLHMAANEMDDAHGQKLPVDFKLRVEAIAVEVAHNWGVNVLGGKLVSQIAVPFILNQQLQLNGEKHSVRNMSNVNLVPLSILNHKGFAYWRYDLQVQTMALGYEKNAPVNIGQHNIGFAPSASITLVPHKGAQNITARFDYLWNNPNPSTHYHSGNEFFTQFDAQQSIPFHGASVGVTGYFYKQITSDTQNGATVVTANADGSTSLGNKGRVFDLGPQLMLPWGKHGAMLIKWDHDMLVQNKVRGNSFWFQFAIPFSYLHHSHGSAD
jgi:hypothetical protein